jgi:hypothetical protein
MNCCNVTNTVVPAFDKIVYLFYMIMNQDLFAEGGMYVEINILHFPPTHLHTVLCKVASVRLSYHARLFFNLSLKTFLRWIKVHRVNSQQDQMTLQGSHAATIGKPM